MGRATALALGVGVMLALVVSLASTASTHTGYAGLFHLGHKNAATAISTLAGPILKVDNNGTGPALYLEANSGRPPLTVNAAAGTATNLSADKIDGKDSNQFLGATVVARRTDVTLADGTTQSGFAGRAAGERPPDAR